MLFKGRSGFGWFSGLCGSRKRRQRWQQAPERDVNSPVQPKTARFYGVQPLFPEPRPGPTSRPMSTYSECGTGTTERNKESSTWQCESTYTYSESGRSTPRPQVIGGEKLERWLGESLNTIPENDRVESEEGYGSRPRTYLLSISSPATTSAGVSTEPEEFELIVQGTSEMSVAGGEEGESNAEGSYARPQTPYTCATGQTSYTATFLLDGSNSAPSEAIRQFLAAMEARQSVDCSSMASEYTDGASWVFRPLQPAPKANSPEGYYDFRNIAGGRGRSNSTNSKTEMDEISTDLIFSSQPNSEHGEQRIVLRRNRSSSTFRSRFGSRHGDRNSKLSVRTPDPPMPSAQIPRRTISIRAVRRRLLEPQATSNQDLPLLLTPLQYLPPARNQGCQCPSSGPAVRMAGDVAASDVSRVHHWVSGQQQHYQEGNSTPTCPSEFLIHLSSIYPIGKSSKRASGSYTFGVEPSIGGDAGSVQGEDYGSPALRPRMRVHDDNCPYFNNTPVPAYQEVDPNSVPDGAVPRGEDIRGNEAGAITPQSDRQK